jgi:hypothetical protein
VFQAFFVSYLVEPGQQKRIETFDELVDSELLYGFSSAVQMIAQTVDFTDYRRFEESRRLDCDDIKGCIKRLLFRRDITTICAPNFENYVASSVGLKDGSKVLCYIDESIFYISGAAILNKGSPFLDRLNSLIRRCLEGGLVDKYWSEVNTLARFQSKYKLPDDNSDFFLYLLFPT